LAGQTVIFHFKSHSREGVSTDGKIFLFDRRASEMVRLVHRKKIHSSQSLITQKEGQEELRGIQAADRAEKVIYCHTHKDVGNTTISEAPNMKLGANQCIILVSLAE
jgi:hypothetical protein